MVTGKCVVCRLQQPFCFFTSAIPRLSCMCVSSLMWAITFKHINLVRVLLLWFFFPPVFQWWAIVSRLTGHRTVSWFSNDQVKEIYFSAPKLLLVPTCYVPFFSYVLWSCINVFRSCCSWASTPFDRNLITLNPLYSCWLFPFNILLLSVGNCWVSSHSCYLVDLT